MPRNLCSACKKARSVVGELCNKCYAEQNPQMKTEKVPLKLIRLDGSTQSRAQTSQAVIEEYAQAMRDGDRFPPVTLVREGDVYWPGDGIHTCFAALLADQSDVEAIVKDGTRQDALLIALAANARHGQRRTDADKEHAIHLARKEFPDVSKARIAEMCRVSWHKVEKVLSADKPTTPAVVQVQKKDGTTYEMQTGKIGKTPTSRARRESEPEDADEPAPESKPKSGSELFPWRKFEAEFGPVSRAARALANAYGDRGPELAEAERILDEYWAVMRRWHERLTGG